MRSLLAGRSIAAAGVLVSLFAARSVARAAGEDGRILVVPVQARSASGSAELRRAEQAVADVFVALGFEVTGQDAAPGGSSPANKPPCDGAACAIDSARSAGAPYVAVVRLVSARKSYSAEVSVIAVADGAGRELGRERIECGASDLCAPLPEIAADAARAAGRRALAERSRLKPPPMQPAATATPGPAVAVAPLPPGQPPAVVAPVVSPQVGEQPLRDPSSETAASTRWAPWVLTAAGVGLVATSGVLFAFDGKQIDCDVPGSPTLCRNRYESTTRAIIAGALGVASLGAGLVLWLRRDDDGSSMALGLSPQGVVAKGAF